MLDNKLDSILVVVWGAAYHEQLYFVFHVVDERRVVVARTGIIRRHSSAVVS